MGLKELKEEVYESWECLSKYKGAIIQPENFKSEVRTYGDLRCRATWEKAYAVFYAKTNWDAGIAGHTAICYAFNFSPEHWQYRIRHEMIEQYLAISEAKESVIQALWEIFNSGDKEDIEYAKQFLEVVGEQQRRTGECTIGHLRRSIPASTLYAS